MSVDFFILFNLKQKYIIHSVNTKKKKWKKKTVNLKIISKSSEKGNQINLFSSQQNLVITIFCSIFISWSHKTFDAKYNGCFFNSTSICILAAVNYILPFFQGFYWKDHNKMPFKKFALPKLHQFSKTKSRISIFYIFQIFINYIFIWDV